MSNLNRLKPVMYMKSIKILKYVSAILFIMYLSYLVYLTFFAHRYGRELIHSSINIVPFKTIFLYLTSYYNMSTVVTNILGNIAAFMPMGFLLPIVFRKLNRYFNIILCVLMATVSIEVFQYITGVGAADIDDVILNLIGGVMGYLIYKVIKFILE